MVLPGVKGGPQALLLEEDHASTVSRKTCDFKSIQSGDASENPKHYGLKNRTTQKHIDSQNTFFKRFFYLQVLKEDFSALTE